MIHEARSVRNTRKADHDVAEVVDFYTDVSGPVLANRFLDSFDHTAHLLRSTPFIGIPCKLPSARYPRLRRIPLSGRFDHWLLFYTPATKEIRIERVIHGARNWRRLFL